MTGRSPKAKDPASVLAVSVMLLTVGVAGITTCAKPCTKSWHKPNSLTAIPGWVYECRTCALPTGHASDCWTDCTTRYTPKKMP